MTSFWFALWLVTSQLQALLASVCGCAGERSRHKIPLHVRALRRFCQSWLNSLFIWVPRVTLLIKVYISVGLILIRQHWTISFPVNQVYSFSTHIVSLLATIRDFEFHPLLFWDLFVCGWWTSRSCVRRGYQDIRIRFICSILVMAFSFKISVKLSDSYLGSQFDIFFMLFDLILFEALIFLGGKIWVLLS